MKRFLSIVLILTLTISAFAQPQQGKMSHNEKMGWWREAKFGMFIHWGPYCLYGESTTDSTNAAEEPNGL